jgi:monovalent cation/hydrogen antiporter
LTTFEWLIGLLLGAVLLSALARRIKVPYPTFLAIGGMLLAFVPSGPSWTLEPDLALALFVAPVLLDAAFDTSVRDLRDNWLPVSTLVFIAVGLPSFRGMRLRRRYLCSLILRSGHAGKFTQPA